MGALNLPTAGTVYVDANCVIYAVEQVAPYNAVLEPLWQAGAAGDIEVVSSELTLLEALVRPLRNKESALVAAFRAMLLESDDFRLIPLELSIIERAAHIRASTTLKTPDALHAATALEKGVARFVINDPAFRAVAQLPVELLSERVG